ncbi:hypothetical protein L596_003077 [Steinernema carpocapsae]|uniref:Uncharacterized protein n=1 Tax=Steinernema carpocapsae TaxID=34508 RepID=A0A4U8UT14_STECR|nr:hypothetical protein L596_003077 [Steinernema carpocapsae]
MLLGVKQGWPRDEKSRSETAMKVTKEIKMSEKRVQSTAVQIIIRLLKRVRSGRDYDGKREKEEWDERNRAQQARGRSKIADKHGMTMANWS